MDGSPNHESTPTRRMKQQSISQVCKWVKNSWESLKHKTIVKSFRKCVISNALDDTEDDVVFEESESPNSNNSNDE
jgi:hypothetical protein